MRKTAGAGAAFGLLLALAVFLTTRAAAASAATFSVAPTPAWIAPVVPADDTGVAEGVSRGQRHLLADYQVRLTDGDQQTYVRTVERIVNESGLEAASQLHVDFDPSFQRLSFHHVVVRRGDAVLDRLKRDAVRIVQRAPNLDVQIYDETVSAVLFLEDLRVGDVVDCAFSIDGADPTLGGRYADAIHLGWDEPIERMYARVLFPKGRHVGITQLGADDGGPAPDIHNVGDDVEIRWDLAHRKAYTAESDAPADYDRAPFAELSEFRSWQEVALLGAKLFDVSPQPAGPVVVWARGALASAASPDDFVLRATRFVQDEVRYVGIEVGVGRRRPTDPATVLQRRFGDCKDKAALLVALMRAGNVKAWPALVSTSRGSALDRWSPTPTVFDHAIVKVSTGTGTYWIDPTVPLQGGGLERAVHSRFERALPLDATTHALDRMTPEAAIEPQIAVRDVFLVRTPESGAETLLDTERVYRADVADHMRATLRAHSREELGKQYAEMYRRDFPAIHDVGDVEVGDDREHDVLRVAAHFGIAGFWAAAQGPRPWRADILARPIEGVLARPSSLDRRAPLGVTCPMRVRYEATLQLPFDLPVVPAHEEVDAPAFHLGFESAYASRSLTYRYDVETRASSVELAELAQHVTAIDKARHLLGRSITYATPLADLPDGPNWPTVVLFLAIAPALVWGARRAYLHNPKPRWMGEGDPALCGLKGWLALLGIGLLVTPFLTLSYTADVAKIVLSHARFGALTSSERPEYHPALAALLVVELVMKLAQMAYGFTLLLAFAGRRRSFPTHFQVYVAGVIALSLADIACASLVLPSHDSAKSIGAIAQTLVYGMVWTAYLRSSRRVAATFVE